MSSVFHAVGNFVGDLFGLNSNNGQEAAEEAQIQQQQTQIQDEQGQQLRLLSTQQAKSDSETAGMAGPGLGRAMLTYNKNTGSAGTLGG